MSWEDYIVTLEQGPAKATYGAIYGHETDPPSVWVQSKNTDKLPITPADVAQIVRSIKTQDPNLFSNGVKIQKQAFTTLVLEDKLLVCQGKGENKDQALVFALTGKTLIIGFNDQPEVKVVGVRSGVQSIQDHLCAAGY
ncbi:hypothetical protein BsWGS_25785 [Bradybaena similaris]